MGQRLVEAHRYVLPFDAPELPRFQAPGRHARLLGHQNPRDDPGRDRRRRFTAPVYWLAVIASTTVGTTLADFADRSLGIGYPGGAALLLALTLGSLFAWRRTLGSIDIATVVDARSEMWYWVTIMFSQTLGTALGDWTADSVGLGYAGAALLFAGLLALVVAALAFTRISRTTLFWTAFVLTRPLGAVVGDYLDKPLAEGGLAMSRYTATWVLFVAIATLILFAPQRAHSGPCNLPGKRSV